MVAVNQIVDERVFRYRTEGVEQTRAQADALAKSQGALARSSDAAASANAGVEKSTRGTADAYGRTAAAADAAAQRQAVLERAQRMVQAAMVQAAAGAEAYDRSLSGIADAQARAAQAAAQVSRASNDNVAALGRESEAYRTAGKFALEHPVLVLAGSVAAARGLSTLSASAATSLGAASVSAARFAAASAEMGGSTATAAVLAAQGLGLASAAASSASGGFASYAESVSGLTTTTSLLTRGLTLIPPAIVPIAAAFAVFAVGAAVFEKAYADLGRLVDLAQRAEKLDVGATFLKSFTDLGPAIRVSTDEMQAALQRASTFVQDRLGQQNGLVKALSDLQSGGYTGGSPLQSAQAAQSAQTTEARIRAALSAMEELEQRGQRLAAIDLADKVFGPALAERLRTGQASIGQIVADLETASGKQLFSDLDAARALALSRAIEDTKRGIDDALKATFNFSEAAMRLDKIWLAILQKALAVAEAANRGVAAISARQPSDFERLRSQIDAKQQELARLEASNVASGYQGDDLKTASVREEVDRLTAAYESLTRAQAPILDARIDQAIGAAAPPARLMSDELAAMAQAAEQAERNLVGTAASAGNAGAALGGAAVKARDFAEALRSIQQANPNLAGTLSLVDRIGKVNRDAVEGSKGVLAQFDGGKIGDGEAQAQIRKLNDEAAASIKALRTEAEKPITGYVHEAEIGKLDQLGQSLARAGDRYGEVRQKAIDFYQVQIDKASPEARGALEQQRTEALGKLDAAYKQNVATARQAATDRAAADRGGGGTGTDAYDNALQRSKDQIQEFDLQARAAGKASEEAYKLSEANRLRRAAASAGRSDEAGVADAIDAQAAAYARARKASEDAQEAQRRLQEGQREVASEFGKFAEGVLLGGTKISDAFASLAKSLSSSTLKALLTGEGPLAGILGTAPTDRGQVGGLLGGKLDLGSLFDSSDISKSLGTGAETGIGKALGEWLKPRTGSNGQGLGVLSSPLGGALGSAAVGGAIGYSSQSPLVGALGGAAAGFAMGNVPGALIGGAVGLLGGLFGSSQAKKQAKRQLQQELQARRDALEQARPQIEALAVQFEGGSAGAVGKQVADAQAQMRAAFKTASDGGDGALADKLTRDFQIYVTRMVAIYADSFTGVGAEMKAGFGLNGPFSQAASSIQQLGETLKGFVTDAGRLSDPAALEVAQGAAVEGALSQLNAPRTLSETQTELARINGTAAGLNQVLKDLGYSADQAAQIIVERTTKALDDLRRKFDADLDRKVNDAQGKSYLNDAADLIKEVAGLNLDAQAVGGDLDKVQTYFTAAAQKIVDSSQLTGDAFGALVQQFPQLNGLVHEFTASVTDAGAALEAIQQRQSGFQDRYFAATTDTSTETGALAAFERQAEQERAAEVKAGGAAINDLEKAQAAERLNIVSDFATKAAEAVAGRAQGYADRYFAATNDATTPAGQLAAFERQAEQERAAEVKAGGAAINDLEKAQAAERLNIVSDFATKAAEAIGSRLQGYADRQIAADLDTSTLEGQLAAYDRKAAQERVAEVKAGGEAINQLEAAQGAERVRIIGDYAERMNAALQVRQENLQDREANATTDDSTLLGQLALFDRKAYREQVAEIQAGGAALADLQRVQALERLKIIQDFDTRAQVAFAAFANTIQKFLDDLKAGSDSPLAPGDRLAAAQAQYDRELALAKAGDPTALGDITTYAQALIEASKAFYASSQGFQDTFGRVYGQLAGLPGIVGTDAFARFATGGLVTGPGTGTSDSVMARLSAGEFVVNAAAARMYGPLLDAMNDNAGSFVVPTIAMPIPVSSGTADDTAMLAELRALREEVAMLRSENRQDSRREQATIAAGAQHVRQGVDEHRAETRKASTDSRQAANKPRIAGTKTA